MSVSKKQYDFNKKAKVGTLCNCAACSKQFAKTHYAQAFCKNKSGTVCKDRYWNTVDPSKRCNTTRISPASAKYMASKERYRDDNDAFDDPSWDSHKDWT